MEYVASCNCEYDVRRIGFCDFVSGMEIKGNKYSR